MKEFQIFSKVPDIYDNMIKDIEESKKYIYLETYLYDADAVGNRFREVLLKKARQGVKIRLLLDAWGGTVDREYFKELISLGAEVRFFREIRYFVSMILKNHERNHRKLLIIDNDICYIGSANITSRCLKWRELVLKMKGDIVKSFTVSFFKSWSMYGNMSPKRIKTIIYKGYHIINDTPDYFQRITENKYLQLIGKSKKEIMIETPYFIPSGKIRQALAKAVKRGVNVKLIIPYYSDVKIVDIVRNGYLGELYKKGININYYMSKTLHSKLMIVDDKFFILGSSNLDYRSFIYQYEINFLGSNIRLIKGLKKYFDETMSYSKPFDYGEWKNRSSIKKIFELLLDYFKQYL